VELFLEHSLKTRYGTKTFLAGPFSDLVGEFMMFPSPIVFLVEITYHNYIP